jgi:hypothetical protein
MKLSSGDFEEIVAVARDYLQGTPVDPEVLPRAFAEATVKLADGCVIGVRCARHCGAVHGQEAEELRAGIAQILGNTSDVDDAAAPDVLRLLRKSLIFLLDRIDARDSLAFCEAIDKVEAAACT